MSGENVLVTTGASFLLTDIGHTTVTAVLFEIVDGVYRFTARGQAPSTLAEPWENAAIGVRNALLQMTSRISRPLLDAKDWLIMPQNDQGAGVDRFGATVSAGEPLRVMLVGLLDDVSLASARRVLQTSYAQEIDCLSLTDSRSEAQQVEALMQQRPDVILIAGGTDDGDRDRVLARVETVAIALELAGRTDVRRPHVIFAGNRALRGAVQAQLGELAMLHLVDNIRPSLEVENVHAASAQVAALYEDLKVSTLPGLSDVADWCGQPMVPTAQALALISRFLASSREEHVLTIDVGSDSVTLVSACPNESWLSVATELGSGRKLADALERVDPADVMRWMPTADVSAEDTLTYALNRTLRPTRVPQTEAELWMESAFLRELLRLAATDAGRAWAWPNERPRPFDRLILRGNVFAAIPRAGQIILATLDALQPTGVFAVSLDAYGVLPACGALVTTDPLVPVQALGQNILVEMGWVIALTGRGQPGQSALELRLEAEGGTLEVDVAFGSLEVLPLAPGQTARLTAKPASRHFDIGHGPGQGRTLTVRGGLLGLVIDARGRPLPLPAAPDERQQRVRQWLWDVGG